jgi:hypothetical protein
MYLSIKERKEESKMNYTKGEWFVTGRVGLVPFTVSAKDKYPIARVLSTYQDDASLIAAAPDLYEILHNIQGDAGSYYGLTEEQKELVDKALAKAEGK